LGGIGHRTLMFDLWNGQVWMRHQPPAAVHQPPAVVPHQRQTCLV
jgi:hypothetical protein